MALQVARQWPLGSDEVGLVAAANDGNVEEVKALIATGSDVNAPSKEGGWRPLHAAIVKGYAPVCEALLNASADITVLNELQLSPLETAVRAEWFWNMNSFEIEDAGEHSNVNPAYVQGGYPKIFRMMLERHLLSGGGVDFLTHRGYTLLEISCECGNADAIRVLKARGADVDRMSTFMAPFHPPLHRAVFYSVEATEALLKCGADVNKPDSNGYSLLMKLIKNAYPRDISLHLYYGRYDRRHYWRTKFVQMIIKRRLEGVITALFTMADPGLDLNVVGPEGRARDLIGWPPYDFRKRVIRQEVHKQLDISVKKMTVMKGKDEDASSPKYDTLPSEMRELIIEKWAKMGYAAGFLDLC